MPSKVPEVYPHAPLEFVVCEIRFPLSPALTQESALPRLQRAFYELFPLIEPVATVMPPEIGMAVGVSNTGLRFMSRDRHSSVSVFPTQLTFETTDYKGYPDFRHRLERGLDALQSIDPSIPGMSRIGLRYIDEIRVPSVKTARDWAPFIDARLLGPMTFEVEGLAPAVIQGKLQFDPGDSRFVVLRYGSLRGQTVGDAPLRRRASSTDQGPYFLIDIDSFWTAGEPIPEFSVQGALEIADQLHIPVRELFESAITDKLRVEVLRRTAK